MSQQDKLLNKLRNARAPVRAKDLQQILLGKGFIYARTTGSHFHYEHHEGYYVGFPIHNGKVERWYVHRIIKIIDAMHHE